MDEFSFRMCISTHAYNIPDVNISSFEPLQRNRLVALSIYGQFKIIFPRFSSFFFTKNVFVLINLTLC